MGNQTNRSAKHEETVESAHLHVVFSLLLVEGAAIPEQINKADSDAAINVEDQVVLLGGGDGLDGNGVVEQLVVGEVLLHVLLDELDTEIGVVPRLDPVADTGDCDL